MKTKEMVVLWVGIAAFVWIGLFPPMGPRSLWHINTVRLLCDWAIVAVLTGGLLYTEPRLTPWLRAHRDRLWPQTRRRAILCMIVGVMEAAVIAFVLICLTVN